MLLDLSRKEALLLAVSTLLLVDQIWEATKIFRRTRRLLARQSQHHRLIWAHAASQIWKNLSLAVGFVLLGIGLSSMLPQIATLLILRTEVFLLVTGIFSFIATPLLDARIKALQSQGEL